MLLTMDNGVVVPKQMNFTLLDDMCTTVFGVDILFMFSERKLADKKTIVISEFSNYGFFWAQFLDEVVSDDFKQVMEIIADQKSTKPADMSCKWCIAKYEDEWFRAFIVDTSPNGKEFKVFYIDYGTSATVKQSDTRVLELDDLWIAPPLAVPFLLKGLTPQQFEQFKERQYETFIIKSLKLIDKTCVYEVELTDKCGRSLSSMI